MRECRPRMVIIPDRQETLGLDGIWFLFASPVLNLESSSIRSLYRLWR